MVFAKGTVQQYNEHMSFVLTSVTDMPVALYLMDDTTPLQDYSGYNNVATTTGTAPARHAPLVGGALWAPILTATTTATMASPVFVKGRESHAFSLEAWVTAIGTASEQQVLGNLNQMDGLTINGNIVSFSTKYETQGESKISFDLQQRRAVHLVAVHTEQKNQLFVDGILVGESEITELQQNDSFVATTNNLHSGPTAGSQSIAINGVAMYAKALTPEDISRHFSAGRRVPRPQDIAAVNGGYHIPVSLDTAPIFVDQWWSTAADWLDATLTGVAVINDQLVPQSADGVSLPGEWIDTFPLTTADTTSIYGVILNWDGEGATVQTSLDGQTWTTAQRGQKIASIPQGFDPTDKVLMIRATFPGGIADDTSYMDNLNVVGLLNVTAPTASGREVSYSNASPEREYLPLAFHDNWGAEIPSGGNITISADTSDDPVPVRTIEVWIKRTGTNPTLSMTGTTYINGAAGSVTLPSNRWVLMHVVSAADVTGSVTINGPCQVGSVTVYDTALSAADINSIFRGYTANDALKVVDNSTLSVLKSSKKVNIYAHDWSIHASG